VSCLCHCSYLVDDEDRRSGGGASPINYVDALRVRRLSRDLVCHCVAIPVSYMHVVAATVLVPFTVIVVIFAFDMQWCHPYLPHALIMMLL
jgi:hypothetical protein